MVAPADFGLSIKVNDVEVASFVPYNSLRWVDYARRVSEFDMLIENPTGVTPARRHTVVVKSTTDDFILFSGTIIELESRKRDNGITVEYDVRCVDSKERLQKSIIEADILTGSDTDILSAFLTNAYPDLSNEFDFSTGVTGFADDLSLPTADTSVLDALNNLAEQTGGNFLVEPKDPNAPAVPSPVTFTSGTDLITEDLTSPFASGTYIGFQGSNGASYYSATGGNPDDCYFFNDALLGSGFSANYGIAFKLMDTEPKTLTELTFDIKINDTSLTDIRVRLTTRNSSGGLFTSSDFVLGTPTGAYQSITWSSDVGGFPQTIYEGDGGTFDYGFGYSHDLYIVVFSPSGGFADIYFDNITISLTEGVDGIADGDSEPELQWSDTPPDAPFDFDVDLSDEFGFDYDLFEGDFDNFNSITVVGGSEDTAIDWTYESDGEQDHFDLETPVKDIAVFKNTGTDVSPTYTAQSLGIWGTDELTGDGGDKDVLYDEVDHWLYFDTNPSNLAISFRVTGTIKKPIRVRVENVADGEDVYAKTITAPNVTSVDDAVTIGQAELDKVQAPKRLTFKTYEPNLRAGQQIDVTDSDRGLNETLVINKINASWISGAKALFEVECGTDLQSDAGILLADANRDTGKSGVSSEITTTSTDPYTDDSGNVMTDDSSAILYEVV